MPASYATKGNFDFQETTNALCKESQQGNLMAQALWGFALVVLSDSPKTTDSGSFVACFNNAVVMRPNYHLPKILTTFCARLMSVTGVPVNAISVIINSNCNVKF